MKPAASFCLTAASNRATVSSTEYLLGLVIRPSSAACAVAGPVQIASESAKLAGTRFLKLIRIPNVLLVSPDRTQRGARDVKAQYIIGRTTRRAREANPGCAPTDTSGSMICLMSEFGHELSRRDVCAKFL